MLKTGDFVKGKKGNGYTFLNEHLYLGYIIETRKTSDGCEMMKILVLESYYLTEMFYIYDIENEVEKFDILNEDYIDNIKTYLNIINQIKKYSCDICFPENGRSKYHVPFYGVIYRNIDESDIDLFRKNTFLKNHVSFYGIINKITKKNKGIKIYLG